MDGKTDITHNVDTRYGGQLKIHMRKLLVYSNIGLGLVVAMLIIIAALGDRIPALKTLENFQKDLRVTLFAPDVEPRTDIVLVTVTEETLQNLGVRSPIPRRLLADVVQYLDNVGAKVIGIDFLIDQNDGDKGSMETLVNTFINVTTPIVLAHVPSDNQSGLLSQWQDAFHQDFFAKLAGSNVRKGNVNIAIIDKDGVRRRMRYASTRPGVPHGQTAQIADILKLSFPKTDEEIVYYGSPLDTEQNFSVLPIHILLDEENPAHPFMARMIKDKIVIVGATLTNTDMHRTAFSVLPPTGNEITRDTAGVYIHAHSVAQIIDGRWRAKRGFWPWIFACFAVLISLYLGLSEFSMRAKITGMACLSLSVLICVHYVHANHAYTGALLPIFSPLLCSYGAFFAGLSKASQGMQENRNFIRNALSHYVSPDIAQQLEKEPERLKLWGENRKLTIMFADIQGFTTLSEDIEAEQLAKILNGYLDGLTNIVLKYGGTLDKYIGDAIVVFWGAPQDVEEQGEKALTCAFEMVKWARAYAQGWTQKGTPLGGIRIGLNSGNTLVGNFGSLARYNYTAIGEAVNLAARLESANKAFGTSILASYATVKTAREPTKSTACLIGEVIVKGTSLPVQCYAFDPDWSGSTIDKYNNAIAQMPKHSKDARDSFDIVIRGAPTLQKLCDIQKTRLQNNDATSPIHLSSK